MCESILWVRNIELPVCLCKGAGSWCSLSYLRLNIASICNPNHEVPDIRQGQTPELFGNDLNTVQIPSSVKDSTCEQFHLYLLIWSNGTLAEFEVFLKGLTEDSIDRAIACFQAAIMSCAILPCNFDPARAQRACTQIQKLTMKGSTATSDMNNIPKIWINLSGLAHSSNLNAIESCITRVFCMRGALSLHHWLIEVVPAAVNCVTTASRLSRKSWIDRLVWHVKLAVDGKRTATFESSTYLPKLAFPSSYTLSPPTNSRRFRYEQTETLISTVSSIVRLWLQFPTDELSLIQLTFIDFISSKSPPSIMFLDKMWDMFTTPFSTAFNWWKVHTSKAKINQNLELFKVQYLSHPFTINGSLEYQKLQHLDRLINAWMEKNITPNDNSNQVH